MPNWCSNSLEITAPTKEILERAKALVFTNESHDENFSTIDKIDFNLAVPMPTSFPDDDKVESGYVLPGWYEWSITNWGTKWNASDATDPVESGTTVSVFFETAWAPPIPWFRALAEAVPEAEFTLLYQEEGMQFSGKEICANGEVVLEDHRDELSLDIFLEMGYDERKFVEYQFTYSLEALKEYIEEGKMTPALYNAVLECYDDEECDFDSLMEADHEERDAILAKVEEEAKKYRDSLTLPIT